MERVKASPDTAAVPSAARGSSSERQNPRGAEYRRRDVAAQLVVARSTRISQRVGSEGRGRQARGWGQPRGMSRSEPRLTASRTTIPKRWCGMCGRRSRRRRSGRGRRRDDRAVRGGPLGDLYRRGIGCRRGRISRPVRVVDIPKKGKKGEIRVLGIPSVVDRVAQAAAAMALEPDVEPIFHEDSYGYCPGCAPVDAVAVCR